MLAVFAVLARVAGVVTVTGGGLRGRNDRTSEYHQHGRRSDKYSFHGEVL
jgi:hypothetical protein